MYNYIWLHTINIYVIMYVYTLLIYIYQKCATCSSRCQDGSKCVQPWKMCDGMYDCVDKSDESRPNCGKFCVT